MAGQLTPVVLLPRFTTLVGADTFSTVGMDVTQYSKALINLWRGPLNGSASPTYTFTFEESSDGVNYTACTISPSETDPGADDETQYDVTIKKRWFRLKIVITGTQPAVTTWAVGFLEERLT